MLWKFNLLSKSGKFNILATNIIEKLQSFFEIPSIKPLMIDKMEYGICFKRYVMHYVFTILCIWY